MSLSSTQDELTVTVCEAVQQLTQIKKAGVLFNTALALIEDGRSEEEVEKYLDVYLRTSGLPKEDVAKALLARGSLNKKQGVEVVQPRSQLGCKEIIDPPWQQVPPEVWEQVAAHTPRYHLRTWLFVSRFYHHIASRHIFHTVDLYFEEDQENRIRTLEIFDRVKIDPIFASHVKSLRLHLGNQGDPLDLILYIFKTALPAFNALQNFEWVGYIDRPMPREMVRSLLNTHKHLHGLGLIGRDFSPIGVSTFDKLRKFTLRVDELANMGEIRTMLDRNECTLKHLTLGGFVPELMSWDLAFESVTINNLTHLDLVDTTVSHFVLTRIVSARNLQSLTLPTVVVDLDAASVLFASDHIIDGSHTLLPYLEAFRLFCALGEQHHYHTSSFYHSVIHFLQKRDKLRRLDLGGCPWHFVQYLLPDLRNLRVLAVHIGHLQQALMKSLVESMPRHMVAIRVFYDIADRPLDQYACNFTRFDRLSFLHLRQNHEHVYQDHMYESLRNIAATIPSLDFLVWADKPFVVVRPADAGLAGAQLEALKTSWCFGYGGGIDFGSDDAAWLGQSEGRAVGILRKNIISASPFSVVQVSGDATFPGVRLGLWAKQSV